MEFERLSEIATVTPGTSPKGEQINSSGKGFPFFQGSKEFKELFPVVERYTEFPVKLAKQGDILISVRAPVGEVNLALQDCAIGRGVMSVRAKTPVEKMYIFYFLKNLQGKWDSLGSTGSVFENLSTVALNSLKIPKDVNRAVAGDVLFNLDKKIATNNALSSTLEDIAQTIFKSWFIDFDPVKAKMNGEKPIGMDDETAALFPDSFEESELGLMPKGWEANHLGNLITPKKGRTITKATCVDGEVPVVAGGLQPAYFHNQANVSAPVVTISASGANAGFVRLYLEDIWASDCSFVSREITGQVFYWYLFLSRNQEQIYGMQQGAAQPHVYPSDLMRLKICTPGSVDLISSFEETVSPLFLEIGALEKTSAVLSQIRDSLLPRLISGELQIPEEMLAS